MDGSSLDLRRPIQSLIAGNISPHDFLLLVYGLADTIEFQGTPSEWDLYLQVENRLAEYTGGHITGPQLIDALQEDLAELAMTSSAA